MKTVKQVSRMSGVSVRTLHHYDAIGLLKPTQVSDAGYRLYDEGALRRLKSILFFRELQFPLKEIKEILDAPNYDPMLALEQQIRLLELQRDHLNNLIIHARSVRETGGMDMNFTSFDKTQMEIYAAQAKAQWGKTEAYQEFQQKAKGRTPEQLQSAGDGLMALFSQIGALRHLAPESGEVQALIAQLQDYITANFYTCTKQILRGLGQMYIAGDSMTANIEKAGGAGTADFAHRAIEIFTK